MVIHSISMAIFNSELLNPIKIPIKSIKIHYFYGHFQ